MIASVVYIRYKRAELRKEGYLSAATTILLLHRLGSLGLRALGQHNHQENYQGDSPDPYHQHHQYYQSPEAPASALGGDALPTLADFSRQTRAPAAVVEDASGAYSPRYSVVGEDANLPRPASRRADSGGSLGADAGADAKPTRRLVAGLGAVAGNVAARPTGSAYLGRNAGRVALAGDSGSVGGQDLEGKRAEVFTRYLSVLQVVSVNRVVTTAAVVADVLVPAPVPGSPVLGLTLVDHVAHALQEVRGPVVNGRRRPAQGAATAVGA